MTKISTIFKNDQNFTIFKKFSTLKYKIYKIWDVNLL